MEASIFTREEVLARFGAGHNCAQSTLVPWADGLGYDPEELERLGAAFGGGMHRGDTCGTVTGALMALGLAYGDDPELAGQKVRAFQAAFTERFGSTYCRELLGYDFSKPDEREAARASGVVTERCPGFVRGASEILQKLMQDA